ncbi:MAG: glycosyltransferase family 2 protein [Clostridia bacterium]|nr:glycosyltransferase family 2 protein [Clostridia bacterium]NCD03152.1 glycosyltransferase family 2 protein [Clostridia bacterium]
MKVSLCTIAYNEEKNLPGLFKDFCRQDYPHEDMEIILVDSKSTDGTRNIMEAFRKDGLDFSAVKVVENHKGNQASGWNQAIMAAAGDVIIRVDSHASIPEDFVRRNVETLESGEDVCGGPRPNMVVEPTPWKETLLLAESSMFGSSIASYRRNGEKSYVNSVFHGAYRRQVFEEVGGFNEELGRTEDNELHYRIRKAGYRICFNPEIHSAQHVRSSLKEMIHQKYGNGYWIGLTSGVCPKCLSLYHFVPFAFVCGILGTSLLAAKKCRWPAKLMWGAYGTVAALMSVFSVKKIKKQVSQLALPFLFLSLHVSYGVGTLTGLLKMPFWRKKHGSTSSSEAVKAILKARRGGNAE